MNFYHNLYVEQILNITILNKDVEVYADQVTIRKSGSTEFEISANLYDKVPNGGVVVLRITGYRDFIDGYRVDGADLEKLIFLEPPSKPLPFTITTDEDDYEPG